MMYKAARRGLRLRGFQHVHIWVEPPRAGDEYIFYARPPADRKPMKREKLRSWCLYKV